MITTRRVLIFPPGFRATCPARHPLTESVTLLPHGVLACEAHVRDGRDCGIVVWAWAHRDGVCVVVPITPTEAGQINDLRMKDHQVIEYLGLGLGGQWLRTA